MTDVTIKMFLLTLCTMLGFQPTNDIVSERSAVDFNQLSEEFLTALQEGRSTVDIENTLANTTVNAIEEALQTDNEKLAFWVNIYNAYIQRVLTENPDLYNNRREFFKMKQIPIAGKMVSFSKIEHGIIRKSQWELGLGYIRKWFPGSFERKLRVDQRDYRIHFALNCGAKSCPPVAIYTPDRLNEQLNKVTRAYLERSTSFDPSTKEVAVTSLFKWFRGDFCGGSGIKDILVEFDQIPEGTEVDLSYQNYDWTLDLGNYTSL